MSQLRRTATTVPPDGGRAEPTASIVVPAHNEEAVLGRCLQLLLDGSDVGELDVVVVANACADRTAAVAREAGARVIETSAGGKVHALRLGDAACRVFPRIYLDADVELDLASARALVVAAGLPGVLACAPVPIWDLTGANPVAQRVHRVHHRLMAPHRALAGVGVYVLGEHGHARAFPLPDVISDDGWVHRCFAPSERIVVDDAHSVVRPARTVRAHLRRRVRVRLGNWQLADMAHPAPEGRLSLGALVVLLRSRAIGPVDAGCYLAVLAADRALTVRQRYPRAAVSWATDSASRTFRSDDHR